MAESSVVMREAAEMAAVRCVVTQNRQSTCRGGSFVLHQAPEMIGECPLASHRVPVVMHEGRAASQSWEAGGA